MRSVRRLQAILNWRLHLPSLQTPIQGLSSATHTQGQKACQIYVHSLKGAIRLPEGSCRCFASRSAIHLLLSMPLCTVKPMMSIE